jgi:hypothetical protein
LNPEWWSTGGEKNVRSVSVASEISFAVLGDLPVHVLEITVPAEARTVVHDLAVDLARA